MHRATLSHSRSPHSGTCARLHDQNPQATPPSQNQVNQRQGIDPSSTSLTIEGVQSHHRSSQGCVTSENFPLRFRMLNPLSVSIVSQQRLPQPKAAINLNLPHERSLKRLDCFR
ncbi:hypothetical protein K443DRAFT_323837 [Laccaria amethystina LaAM-08-1]|uniref:Uncharacterized protein n=1 Tax=Laccaria amethystina LaAM-08-1 TaxID=1095629 RepID=A0A0C9XHH4_9AGAR|nr:hypothetical protein K443DRAFT_323837 [Laccaria amethystina LaAM-08-1]